MFQYFQFIIKTYNQFLFENYTVVTKGSQHSAFLKFITQLILNFMLIYLYSTSYTTVNTIEKYVRYLSILKLLLNVVDSLNLFSEVINLNNDKSSNLLFYLYRLFILTFFLHIEPYYRYTDSCLKEQSV